MGIYKKPEYGTLYQPHAQSVGFNPERAYDTSGQILQQTERRVEDVKTLARSAARQAELDQQRLAVGRAFAERDSAVLRGLLALSGTAMGAFKEYQEQKAQQADEDALLESIGFGEQPVELAPEAKQEDAQYNAGVQAEAKAVSGVASGLKQQPDLTSQSVAHSLMQSTAYKALEGVNGNAYTAMSSHAMFLSEALRNLPPELSPKTAADAQILMRELNRQFLRGTGMMGAPREQLVKLARTMAGNTQNAIVNVVSSAIKTQQESNLSEAQGFTSTVTDAAGDPQEIWKQVSDRYAFGNLGYTGHSTASNQAALEDILNNAVESGNTGLIQALRKVQQVPGQAGTELEKKFDHVFDKYEKAARTQAIQDYNLQEAEGKIQMKQSLEFYYNDPSPENRQKAVAILRQLGTEEALQEADRLSANGLNYDPQKKFELLELQAKGVPIPEETLKTLLDNGTISAAEYKQFGGGKDGAAKQAQKAVDDYIKKIDNGLLAAMQGNVPDSAISGTLRSELTIRHQALVEELRSRILAEAGANPAILSQPSELMRIAEAQTKYLLSLPHYKMQATPKGVGFAGSIRAEQRLARITVAPGVQDFSKLKPEDVFGKLKIPRSEMDPTKDRFLSMDQLRADAKAVVSGKPVSNTARLYAKNLGISPTAFIEGQLGVNGLPGLSILRQGPEYQQLLQQLTDIPNASNGLKVLQSMGFPQKGAAFIAGNIQQESGWHGLRDWGQVAGDASNRNGGLVSWASFPGDSARLGRIEKHFGKPIASIPESDQLAYMVKEMKSSYPDAYRVFMNPNASDADLQWASRKYWGYRDEGARFSYARNLLSRGTI